MDLGRWLGKEGQSLGVYRRFHRSRRKGNMSRSLPSPRSLPHEGSPPQESAGVKSGL